MPGFIGRTGDEKIDIDFTLRKVFGKDQFRPVQREVITACLQHKDVFLQAATSFGKSLCFQLPAVVDFGITIVISPLLALMHNQLAGLKNAGINVATLNSTTPWSVKQAILDDLRSGHPRTRLLYVTPELCTFDHFRKNLRIVYEQKELARIAVDEAHCISEWGHDFRTSFLQLNFFKNEFPDVPLICCTATATQAVRDDVINVLGLDRNNLECFTMTTSRPNLHFEIRFTRGDEDHYHNFVKWIRATYERRRNSATRSAELREKQERITSVPGIIYALYRRDVETLAQRLTDDGIGAKPYHAGLTPGQKEDHLAGWIANKEGYDIIVATTAFGMGIDKDNVRFVVHWQIPKSFEGFYQEAGRAGRDGKASICIFYYSREDRERANTMMQNEFDKFAQKNKPTQPLVHRAKSLQALIEYCENIKECRHKLIAEYFGEPTTPKCSWACDFCKDPGDLALRKEKDLSTDEYALTQSTQQVIAGEYMERLFPELYGSR